MSKSQASDPHVNSSSERIGRMIKPDPDSQDENACRGSRGAGNMTCYPRWYVSRSRAWGMREMKMRFFHMSHLNKAEHGDADHDGPAWPQQHGCRFVTGITLGARGSRHANGKEGGERMICNSTTTSSSLADTSEDVIYMYATRDKTRMKWEYEHTKTGQILLYTAGYESGNIWS